MTTEGCGPCSAIESLPLWRWGYWSPEKNNTDLGSHSGLEGSSCAGDCRVQAHGAALILRTHAVFCALPSLCLGHLGSGEDIDCHLAFLSYDVQTAWFQAPCLGPCVPALGQVPDPLASFGK